ncbi:ferritin-like domain-containing protein [Actinospica robiniae]|uniref:ferritin-like domain-containing protein n=1 Tax=Actinospica robiniae TaxID=304901 RepID=UPI00040BA0ED|nr:ferritin-like domain-containing protein [Actinospica robiniae]
MAQIDAPQAWGKAVAEEMTVQAEVAARFTWRYDGRDGRLTAMYEKAKSAQWNASADIEWANVPEFGSPLPDQGALPGVPLRGRAGSPVPAHLWERFRWEYHAWMTSQFLHGEQGALLATSRIVETVPDLEAKLFAATQVADEARHVEAYATYLDRLGAAYPIDPPLRTMLAHIIGTDAWDLTFLGMQVIVEGIALAMFRLGNATSFDPVIRRITELVARDESRHVAFGVLALEGLYPELTSRELAEREEFVKESALLMARRFGMDEVWERLGVDVAEGVRFTTTDPIMVDFRRLMFTRVTACLVRVGLFTDSVRAHLEQLSLVRPSSAAHR